MLLSSASDSDEEPAREREREKKKIQKETKELRERLKRLTSKTLVPQGISRSYLTPESRDLILNSRDAMNDFKTKKKKIKKTFVYGE